MQIIYTDPRVKGWAASAQKAKQFGSWGAVLPAAGLPRGSQQAAGYDLFAAIDKPLTLRPGEMQMVLSLIHI